MPSNVDTLQSLFISRRHYVDDYKAYDHNDIYQMSDTLFAVFRNMFVSDLETGRLTISPEFTEEQAQAFIEKITEIEQRLVANHNPDADKIYLWEANNMPWHLMTREEFSAVSFNPPDFIPHVITFLHNDGKQHPSIILSSGNCRWADDVYPAAEFYQSHGYNAFVLANRHASGEKIRQSLIRSLDLQRAIRVIRKNADKLGVDPDKIITNGFSMGNRATIDLINRLGIQTSPDTLDPSYHPDEIDTVSARVNAYISIFPAAFPNDIPCNYADFPPVFGAIGNIDFSLWRMIPFYSDLALHQVPVELHMFEGIDHGFGISRFNPAQMFPQVEGGQRKVKKSNSRGLSYWPDLLLAWLDCIF